MAIPLFAKTKRAAEILLSEPDRQRITDRMVADTSEDIPMWHEFTPEGLERIRFSILKLVAQNPQNENIAFENAAIDWRELFVSAGFAESAIEHETWYQKISKQDG